jgi:hypothetical protein
MSAVRPGHSTRLAFAFLLAVVALGALATPVAFAAAVNFNGGPVAGAYPLYVSDDHSVYALRFAVTGYPNGVTPLSPGTQYYYKVRICPQAAPGAGNQVGFVWNALTQRWVQEREATTNFPKLPTVDANGLLADSGWVYFKFGHTTWDSAVTPYKYYIVISIQQASGGNTYNASAAGCPQVTRLDMTSTSLGSSYGSRVHNGTDTGVGNVAGVQAVTAGGSTVLADSLTEMNGVDDDCNGVVDYDDWGPSGYAGDFHLAVPTGQALDLKLAGSDYAAGFTPTVADADYALGAADQSPPTAPTGLTASPLRNGVTLSWNASSDDVGVTFYRIYRATSDGWTYAQSTPPYVPIAATTGTTFTDYGTANGVAYDYIVRAGDAATNESPRAAVSATTPPTLSLTSFSGPVTWASGSTKTVTWTLNKVALQGEFCIWLVDGANRWGNDTHIPVSPVKTSYSYDLPITVRDGSGYRLYLYYRNNTGVWEWQNSTWSNNDITISGAPVITLTSPTEPVSWKSGSSQRVTWEIDSIQPQGEFRIWLVDSANRWENMTSVPVNPSERFYSYDMPITARDGNGYRMYVYFRNDTGVWNWQSSACTDGDITITGAPAITLTSPTGPVTWAPLSTPTVTWEIASGQPEGEFRIWLVDSDGRWENMTSIPVDPGETHYSYDLPITTHVGSGYRMYVYFRNDTSVWNWQSTTFSNNDITVGP